MATTPIQHDLRLPTTVVPSRYELVLVPDMERFLFQGVVWIHVRVCAPDVRAIVMHSADLTYDLTRFKTRAPNTHTTTTTTATPQYAIHLQPYNSAESLYAQTSPRLACTSLHLYDDVQRVHMSFGDAETNSTTVLRESGEYVLGIVFEGVLNDQLCGFYRSQYTCSTTGCIKHTAVTQFEATDARRALPCWDEPAIKAVFDVTLVCPDHLACVSNMPVTRRTVTEASASMATTASSSSSSSPISTSALHTAVALGIHFPAGLVEYVYAPSPIMSTYLLAFVVGEFDFTSQRTKHDVLVSIYTPPGKLHLADFSMNVAVRALEYFVDYFGIAYPLPKVDLLAIADFAAGAMENWGCITYRESALLIDPEHSSAAVKQRCAKTVCHELAHMWFGNLVTMEWWTYLWLNEGFARFMEHAAADHIFPEWDLWTQFIQDVYAQAQRLDALESSHAVEVVVRHQDEINEIFDLISYAKGASLIRMLNDSIGCDAFERGVRTYLQRHLYGNATTEDLWRALADESGANVAHMMDQWVKRVGYPVISVSEGVVSGQDGAANKGETQFAFFLKQEVYLSSGKRVPLETPWVVPIRVGFHRVAAEPTSSSVSPTLATATTPVPTYKFMLDTLQADVVVPLPTITTAVDESASAADSNAVFVLKFNHHQSGFFIIEYDDALFTRVSAAVHVLPPIDRLGLLRDTFASAIAGRLPMTRALDLMHRLRADEDFSVVSALSDNVTNLMSLHGASEYKAALQHFIGDLFTHTFDLLGWAPSDRAKVREGHITSLFRSVVIGAIALSGRADADEHAYSMLVAFHAKPEESPIAADLRPMVYSMAIRHAGEKARSILLEMVSAPDAMAEEKQRILGALGTSSGDDVADAESYRRLLDFAFTSGGVVRTNELVFILTSLASTRIGRDITWAHLKSTWSRIEEIFSAGSAFMIGHVLSGVLSGFASDAAADDVRAFFTAHPCLPAERTIQQCEENIRSRAVRLAREERDVREWLATRGVVSNASA